MKTLAEVPTSLLRAKAWAFKGDNERARQAYANALKKLRTELRQDPDDPPWLDALGMAEAGLGRKREAIQAGLRATQLLPISKDANYGTVHLVALARIYAQTGEPAQAVKLLHKLLSIPSGEMISIPMLRLDPVWDPIRHDPRFQALLREYAQLGATPSTTGSGS